MNTVIKARRGIYYGWWVLAVAVMAVVFDNGPTWALGTLKGPMVKEFGWNDSQLFGVVTAAGLLGTIISPFAGRLVDRYGARIVITAAMFFFGVMLVLTGQVKAIWQFYLFYAVGLAVAQSAVMRVGAPAIAANWFLRKRAIAFGAIFGGTAIAGMVFPQVSQVLQDLWGWRTAWTVIGLAIAGVGAPLAWAVVRRRPEDMGLHPDGDDSRALPGAVQKARRRRGNPVGDVSWTLQEALRTRTFWILNVCMTLPGFAGGTVFLVMHSYFSDLGYSPTRAAGFVSFYAFTALLAIPLWTILAQVFGVRNLLVPYALFYGVGIALFVTAGRASMPVQYLAIVPLGIGITGGGQVGNQVWADFYGRKNVGTIIGVAGLFRIVSMAGGPLLAAGIHDLAGGYAPAFYLFSAFSLLAGIGLVFAKPPQMKEAVQKRVDLEQPRAV